MTKVNSKSKHIVYKKGDIFHYIQKYISDDQHGSSIIIPHVCNNVGTFGAGFVSAINKHYPIVRENYNLLGNDFLRNNLGYTQYVTVSNTKRYNHQLIIANMIAQNGTISYNNKRPLDYYALVKCMSSVSRYIEEHLNTDDFKPQIHCPKFGSGLAGGNWNFIENLIEDIWKKFIVVIYQL